MEQDALGEILRVEKSLRDRMESERLKAETGLEAARKAVEDAVAEGKKRLEAEFSLRLQRAREDSIKQAAEKVNEARRLAEGLKNAPEGMLSAIVLKHIRRILPGDGG